MPIDPTDAPDGFIAVPFTSCRHCDVGHKSELCREAECTPTYRKDGYNCMFKEKPPSHSECLALDVLVNHRARPLTEADFTKMEERLDTLGERLASLERTVYPG